MDIRPILLLSKVGEIWQDFWTKKKDGGAHGHEIKSHSKWVDSEFACACSAIKGHCKPNLWGGSTPLI